MAIEDSDRWSGVRKALKRLDDLHVEQASARQLKLEALRKIVASNAAAVRQNASKGEPGEPTLEEPQPPVEEELLQNVLRNHPGLTRQEAIKMLLAYGE